MLTFVNEWFPVNTDTSCIKITAMISNKCNFYKLSEYVYQASVVQCVRQDVSEYHAACHHACPQARVSRLMKSDKQVQGLAQRAPTPRGSPASEDSCSSADQQSVTSPPVATSQDLFSNLKSSRQQRLSELRTAPAMFATILIASAVGREGWQYLHQ